MKINWGFGPPKDDPDASGGSSLKNADTEQHGWTAGANLGTKLVVGVLWVTLAAGPLALGLQLMRPAQAQYVPYEDSDVEVSAAVNHASAVGGFAERAVIAWLETPHEESDRLATFFGDLDQSRPEFPWTVEHAAPANIVKLEDGLWSVTIGADVTEAQLATVEDPELGEPVEPPPDEQTSSGPQRLYFQVPILYVDGAMIAQALPAPVPGPDTVAPIATAYRHELDGDHPAAERISNFLTALLVSGDQDELDAYSAPGAEFRAIIPAAYAGVEVTRIGLTQKIQETAEQTTSEPIEVFVEAVLVGVNGQELSTQYVLALKLRAGRWEVSSILRSPLITSPVPDSQSTTTGAPDEPADLPTDPGSSAAPNS